MRKFISTNFRTDHCSSSGGREIRNETRKDKRGWTQAYGQRERERQIENWLKPEERETEQKDYSGCPREGQLIVIDYAGIDGDDPECAATVSEGEDGAAAVAAAAAAAAAAAVAY